ncbi:hypothetical protein POL68_39800 [Stigmatella sp. ncwal1]|uniref:Bacteriocin-type signal sequence-containing protein n=1 Tax=Stigmatella ashevillensis TaxID=2995309 RepID=A0ABT5DQL6_9BACT|nr:hypothetical protein [Stigmatella ashevillena]MDC0714661.1 hypothetical protein [Stigmatella ashevillena]
MKRINHDSQPVELAKNVREIRPLARLTAQELSPEDLAKVSGGWSSGISNAGGWGDRDLQN